MATKRQNEVRDFITKQGMRLEGEYKNLKTPIEIICSEGHRVEVLFGKFQKNPECRTCSLLKQKEKEKETILSIPSKKEPRLLALDNATHKSGYAIFEGNRYVDGGIHLSVGDSTLERVVNVKQWFENLMLNWKIDMVALENVQFQENKQTVIILSKLLGALEVISYELLEKPPLVVYAATWKSFCQIKGKTRLQQKENARLFAQSKVELNNIPTDLADAICLGYYAQSEFLKGGPPKKVEILNWADLQKKTEVKP